MKNTMNRRRFLKASARGAAALGLAEAAQHLPLSGVFAAQARQDYNSAAAITALIKSFTAESPLNSLRNEAREKAWDEPLVGFAGGEDAIFELFKDKVGPFHWTPLEIFRQTFPDTSVRADELMVVSWVLPHTEPIKADLRKQTTDPSEKWIRARIYGEEFNEELRRHVAASLTKAGHQAVAPTLSTAFRNERSERYGMASSWSERHAAYAAGLGTFGLCDGLITAKGKAIRCGSVVARVRVPATLRPYEDHHAYCLYYAKGTCGMCTQRCPAGAVTKSGHDKQACMKQCAATAQVADKKYGLKGYGCGFCQTGVPCESRNPVA